MWTNKDDVALLNLINGDLDLETRKLLNRARETLNRLARDNAEALDVAQKAINLAGTNADIGNQAAKDHLETLKQLDSVKYLNFLGRM